MKISRLWPVPKDLGEYGRRLWRNVGPLLAESGSLDELDRETFESLCRVYHKFKRADLELEEAGLSMNDARGSEKKPPQFTMWKAYSELYIKLLSHFGLSPSSRGMKIRPREEEQKNGKSRFFK